jgi:hypothetical protein
MRKIETYDRFSRHILAWSHGEIDSLLVLGRPGTGKSHSYRELLREGSYHLFSARKSPIQVYTELYEAPNKAVVFDDISALLKDSNFLDMLKALCETGKKTIRWGTTTAKLEGRATSFVSTSPVLIVLNRMPDKNEDVRAVLDRCDAIEFAPTKAEVVARMRAVFPGDGELIDLLAELPVLPSLRTLVKAKQWARSKYLSLTEELSAECGVPEPVVRLVEIMQECRESEWCQRYIEVTGLTDRTYRRHKAIASDLVACRRGQADIDLQTPLGRDSRAAA